jgi:hypothetical protein
MTTPDGNILHIALPGGAQHVSQRRRIGLNSLALKDLPLMPVVLLRQGLAR